jgi:hypothetical protein
MSPTLNHFKKHRRDTIASSFYSNHACTMQERVASKYLRQLTLLQLREHYNAQAFVTRSGLLYFIKQTIRIKLAVQLFLAMSKGVARVDGQWRTAVNSLTITRKS